GPVPEEIYAIPLGQAKTLREGGDITIVAIGRMALEAQKAADTLAADGISAEVIDPRTVQPFDTAAVVASVKRTNRVLIVHEAVTFAGIGAEISSQIQEEAFDYLDAPVMRLGAPFSPVPFSPVLESAYVPDAARIASGAHALLARV
ncbi:transketolase C-terminal domain-containing protein, partial [Aeromicrobium sp.]|uniref:transketolase C-terminal domain-containing protein n=1 Tax=Aeromicrobium sp. TaxID=1871063 RepID=UPI001998D0BB